MPADLPAHNDPITYHKGKWVPVGWKPLVTSERTRKAIFASIARRNAEAFDKESQRKAIKKRKEEKREQKRRAAEELQKIEVEVELLKRRREELAEIKHAQFSKLKTVIQKESQLKKIEEDRRRKEAAQNFLMNPALAAKAGAVQSTSLISQQNLFNPQLSQQFYPSSSNYQNIIQAHQLQNHIMQQMSRAAPSPAKPVIHQQLLQPSTSHTPVRSQLIPPAAQSPFYPGSNYASPAPSRNFLPQQPTLNSPRRDRTTIAPTMASPGGTKFVNQTQSRHNSFVGGNRPDHMRVAETGSPASSPSNLLKGLAGYQQNDAEAAAAALHRGYLLQQQHQASPQRR